MAGNRQRSAANGWVLAPARRWFGRGLDLVYPPVCAYCHGEIEPDRPAAFCETCRAGLMETRPACPRCGTLAPELGDQRQDCPRCAGRRLHFDRVWRLGSYEGALRNAVLRMKRPAGRALALAAGDLLAESAGSQLSAIAADAVVPVPMHWTRRAWRGANSADVVARRLATHLHVALRPGLLARHRRTAPQASLPRSRRRANVRGAFRARKHPDLAGARVLLVDDIMTSGATLNEAAKTLAKSGACFIAVAVLARAEGLD